MRIKFRVGQIVFVTLSADETLMGFAFPREQREALIAAEAWRMRVPKKVWTTYLETHPL
ncbi:hypothetical protein [Amycolatopsis sp. DG1A-15b]|uniref:hypothetical protein n=1 Tax=Amycolatopsis sp. DG1A-15b TaxID=3052846 RepID=UPI00255B88D8|nr:hypothetical protein [Amycolatopsis sp. DG1A-15b]WIX90951.1 hypothetical protein QRY02_11115 [Amycolatopsis sp. DG1A-15b]